MSEHHTRIDTDQLLAEIEELEQLKTGNTQAVKQAERRVEESINQQRRNADNLQRALSKERAKNIQRAQAIVHLMKQNSSSAVRSANIVQNNMKQLNDAIIEASSSIEVLVQEAKERASSAEQLYLELTKDFMKTESFVQYRRFAADMKASIRERLSKLCNKEVSDSAMQLMTTSVIADIYQMDLLVTREQAVFDINWIEAKRILESTISQLESAKSENYEEIGNHQSELLDINYWTDGRFNDLELELKDLNQRVSEGYNDSSYSNEMLKSDLNRIIELEKAKDLIISEARIAYNQSKMREDQALAAMDILIEDHQFSLVGKGFEGNDRRESFILRMQRHTDNAEIEVIVSPTSRIGEYNLYFRLDTKTYSDESVIRSITEALANDFKEAGLKIDVNPYCCAERLEPFNIARPTISDAARHLHNIPEPQQHTQI